MIPATIIRQVADNLAQRQVGMATLAVPIHSAEEAFNPNAVKVVLVDGKPWQSYPTREIANDLRFFQFVPGEHWHSFEGYAENQYFVDPCKLLLTTPGIDARNGEYAARSLRQ